METVAICRVAVGRVLAEAVVADRDQPPFDRSTRDGFAVRAGDAWQGPWLAVAGQVQAGQRWERAAGAADQTIEIMTGAPVPEGADAVVMLEHVEHAERGMRAIRLPKGADDSRRARTSSCAEARRGRAMSRARGGNGDGCGGGCARGSVRRGTLKVFRAARGFDSGDGRRAGGGE